MDSLEHALQRIQAVAAELRLPAPLAQIASPRLELMQAFGIVCDLLRVYGKRVEIGLPHDLVALEPLPLCHLIHTMLVSHMDAKVWPRSGLASEPSAGAAKCGAAPAGLRRFGRAGRRVAILLKSVLDFAHADTQECGRLAGRAGGFERFDNRVALEIQDRCPRDRW